MTKNLYRATIVTCLYVMAHDDEGARSTAEDVACKIPALKIALSEVRPGHVFDPDFSGTLPWGDDNDEATVDAILDRIEAMERAREIHAEASKTISDGACTIEVDPCDLAKLCDEVERLNVELSDLTAYVDVLKEWRGNDG